jgi:hypothetical protein
MLFHYLDTHDHRCHCFGLFLRISICVRIRCSCRRRSRIHQCLAICVGLGIDSLGIIQFCKWLAQRQSEWLGDKRDRKRDGQRECER